MTQECFSQFLPLCTRDTVVRDMAHNPVFGLFPLLTWLLARIDGKSITSFNHVFRLFPLLTSYVTSCRARHRGFQSCFQASSSSNFDWDTGQRYVCKFQSCFQAFSPSNGEMQQLIEQIESGFNPVFRLFPLLTTRAEHMQKTLVGQFQSCFQAFSPSNTASCMVCDRSLKSFNPVFRLFPLLTICKAVP